MRVPITERNHVSSQRELGIRFALWAAKLQGVPTLERIQRRFEMSRATAYRWRQAWCLANGLESRKQPAPKEEPRNRRLKQSVMHHVAVMPSRKCRECAFFRIHDRARWGTCKRNEFPTRGNDTCASFTKKA